jgi:hypothetical protein
MARAKRWGLIGMTVGGLILGSLSDNPLPASAHGPTARTAGHSKSPVGSYTIFSSNGGEGDITILTDHSFTTGYGDSGIWDSLSASVALLVTASTEGDNGCVFLGSFTKKGINSEGRPGPQNCGSFSDTWYATAPPKKRVRPGDGSSTAPSHPSVRAAKNPTGTYDYIVPGFGSSTLDIEPDGTIQVGDDTGYWVSLGRAIEFSDISEITHDGCVSLGTFNRSGIGSVTKPAQTRCGANSPTYWYAPVVPS